VSGPPIPGEQLFTREYVARLYEEFGNQDKDLRAFLKDKGLSAHYKAIATRFGRLERRLAKTNAPPAAPGEANKVVKETVVEAISAEARDQTEQFLVIGKAVMSAYFKYAAARGMNLEQIKKTPVHEIIIRALEKEPKYDALVERNQQLEDEMRALMQEVNPIFRLKSAIQLMNEFLLFVDVGEALGFNIEDSPLIGHYQRLIELYLKGSD
jgi:hypothetical protein